MFETAREAFARSCGQFHVIGFVTQPAARRRVGNGEYQVAILGRDVLDPVDMNLDHREGNHIPARFLDTDCNGPCFHVCQTLFPQTSAWGDPRRSLRGEFVDSLWTHLSGTASAPFEAGEHELIAVKTINDRGNEVSVVKAPSETPS